MKTYKLEDKDKKGLLRVSLVEDPAIESKLMAFASEEDKPLLFANDEKQIIYAPALIPNKLIFRKDVKGEPAQVFFDAETIKELHINGSRLGYDSRINLQHQDNNTDGIFCFENWIIEDKPQDKAYKMGFDVPVGTLMKGYKIDNADVWNDIKSGKITGLSIEALLSHLEVKMSKNETVDGLKIWFENNMITEGTNVQDMEGNNLKDGSYELMTNAKIEVKDGLVTNLVTFKKEDMNKPNLMQYAFAHIKALFAADPTTEVATGFFGSSLEVGSIITDMDGNVMPNAEFEANGNKYKTDDMGAISEIEPIEDAPVADPAGGTDELAMAQARILELETEVADLKAEISKSQETQMANETNEADYKAKIEKLEAEIIEAKRVQPEPTQVELSYDKMTNLQKAKYNRGLL